MPSVVFGVCNVHGHPKKQDGHFSLFSIEFSTKVLARKALSPGRSAPLATNAKNTVDACRGIAYLELRPRGQLLADIAALGEGNRPQQVQVRFERDGIQQLAPFAHRGIGIFMRVGRKKTGWA